MKIDYFICFQYVAKYRSFSEAAERLYITQSSLSKKIKALEEELGGELFLRKGNKSVVLSPFGDYVFNYISNILEDYEVLLSATENYRLNHQKKLTIATFLNIAHSGILKPITTFEAQHENFYIETMEKDHSMLIQTMTMKHAEVCFGYREILGEPDDYEIVDLFKDPLIMITSQQYAEQQNWGATINLADAKNSRFCFPREDMEIFTFLIKTCKNHGFMPQLTNSDVRLGTIRQYISAGMRCTLQFESISRSKFYDNQFVFIELENPPMLTLSLYSKKSHPRKIRDSFVDYIINYYKPMPQSGTVNSFAKQS